MNEHRDEINPFKFHCSQRERCALWDGFVLGVMVTVLGLIVVAVFAGSVPLR